MPTTQQTPEFLVIPAETRRVVREARLQLGLSRAELERRAKVGKDYLKRLELGRHPSVDAARLRRMLQALQQAAARRQVPATLQARLTRVVTAAAKPGRRSAAR